MDAPSAPLPPAASDSAPSAEADAPHDGVAARAPRKSATAFRTISEVADELHVPQHVLRFWEGKFPQLRPLKRGGGRRYYRPEDIALLRRIGDLLYTQGYTIKGVQRVLRDGSAPGPGGARGAAAGGARDGRPAPGQADASGPAPADAAAGTGGADDLARRSVLRECLAELEDIAARLRSLATPPTAQG